MPPVDSTVVRPWVVLFFVGVVFYVSWPVGRCVRHILGWSTRAQGCESQATSLLLLLCWSWSIWYFRLHVEVKMCWVWLSGQT